jgi:hypothetical protein
VRDDRERAAACDLFGEGGHGVFRALAERVEVVERT